MTVGTNEYPDEESADDQGPSQFDDFDDIDGRAADLLARIAAQRQQRQPHPSGFTDEPIPLETGAEYGSDEPEYAAASPAEVNPHDTTAFEDTEATHQHLPPICDDEPEPDNPEIPRATRRTAVPPWQTGEPRPDTDIGEESTVTQDEPPIAADDDRVRSTQQSSRTPASPLQAVPALPPPGWHEPLPGWPPGLPPPPPGWQGMPPWLPAPGQFLPQQSPGQDRRQSSRGPTQTRTDYVTPQTPWVPPSLDDAEILNRDELAPQSGWRRALHNLTGGRINPGVSQKERDRQELLEQIRRPIVGDFRIAVLSIKGGVGKTTTTLGLGSALATVRADRIIAVDANPDRGTLAERVPDTSTSSTVRDLLRDHHIGRYADVRNHTRMAPSRLEVLASEQDPAVSEVFGEADYRRAMDILRHYYNVILTDCGTGIMHSAMVGVLDLAQAIVLVSSPAIDAARSASATLDWLARHGHGDLVRESHVVLTALPPGSEVVKLNKVFEHFEARCGSIHMIPFEPHLAEGADFDFELLAPSTAQAYLELAAAVSEKFSRPRSSYDVPFTS